MTCRNCKYLVVPPDSDGKRRIRKARVYRCAAPDPTVLHIPNSISISCDYKRLFSRRFMEPDEGVGCPAMAFKLTKKEIEDSTTLDA